MSFHNKTLLDGGGGGSAAGTSLSLDEENETKRKLSMLTADPINSVFEDREFKMFKFRSMWTDAEERLNECLPWNKHSRGVTFKMKNDPRLTRVARSGDGAAPTAAARPPARVDLDRVRRTPGCTDWPLRQTRSTKPAR